MIFWEAKALDDREKIFEYLYRFNPLAAEQTDALIEQRALMLLEHPEMGVVRESIQGRLLIIPEISMTLSYWIDGQHIRIMRVLHHKQKFPLT